MCVCSSFETVRENLLLHVDGCIGGFYIPFLRKMNKPAQSFDFTVPGVTSISVDLHKYAFCAKGASVVVYRDRDLRRHQLYAFARWPGYTIVNNTFSSSKSGGPVAAAWAVLHHLGEKGYMRMMKQTADGVEKLANGCRSKNAVGKRDLYLVAEPESSLLCIGSDTADVFHVADLMKDRGWYIQPQLAFQSSPANIHISVNPQAAATADKFLMDLKECVEEAKGLESLVPVKERVHKALAKLKGGDMTREVFDELCSAVGLSSTEVPDKMAHINAAMDAIEPGLREQTLVWFLNDLFSYDSEQAAREAEQIKSKKVAELKQMAFKAGYTVGIGIGIAVVGSAIIRALK